MKPDTTNRDEMDLICFSHLRWGSVFQRPQHLMSRFARKRRVFFIEEPVYGAISEPLFSQVLCPLTGVTVVTPKLPEALRSSDTAPVLRELLGRFLSCERLFRYVAWFYTPMALDFASGITPEVTVYDCMDELSLFRGAPARLCEAEETLFKRADLVFTGGVSLFEAKQHRHGNVHAFPSGVDTAHFFKARWIRTTFEEHNHIPRPRLGYAGVIDERLDLDLIDQVAQMRPAWQMVMIGPVVKIDPGLLPQHNNVHWLGIKDYRDLPRYFAGWDVGLLPFALNDSTRFISPTKTPEYLAAGLPVVSTPIRDVVRPYGDFGMARIAKDADEFVAACEQSMAYGMSHKWRRRADQYLETLSWDDIWKSMDALIHEAARPATIRKPAVMSAGQTMPAQSGPEALRV